MTLLRALQRLAATDPRYADEYGVVRPLAPGIIDLRGIRRWLEAPGKLSPAS